MFKPSVRFTRRNVRKKTTEEFIEQARTVHGNRYDYSLVDYKGLRFKVEILCETHGLFLQSPFDHLKSKHGCKLCSHKAQAENNALSTETFIERSKLIHGERYRYDKVRYKKFSSKVEIVCLVHGSFWQIPVSHWSGSGCPKCGREDASKTRSSNTEEFINKSLKVHGRKYDYSKVQYFKSSIKVEIVCKNHGIFSQTPDNHLNGFGCNECGRKKTENARRLSVGEFKHKATAKHGDKYNYSLVKYVEAKTKVKLLCGSHGEFTQTPDSHLSGSGCPRCSQSKGEQKVRNTLQRMNLSFKEQISFKDCRDIKKLRFDFGVYHNNSLVFLIEFQGKQHYEPVDIFGGEEAFRQQQRRDEIKRDYCSSSGLLLLEIPYSHAEINETIERFVNIAFLKKEIQ